MSTLILRAIPLKTTIPWYFGIQLPGTSGSTPKYTLAPEAIDLT